eukprot:scaffold78461_cov30-Tisochrysis_lutea.AAC.1
MGYGSAKVSKPGSVLSLCAPGANDIVVAEEMATVAVCIAGQVWLLGQLSAASHPAHPAAELVRVECSSQSDRVGQLCRVPLVFGVQVGQVSRLEDFKEVCLLESLLERGELITDGEQSGALEEMADALVRVREVGQSWRLLERALRKDG